MTGLTERSLTAYCRTFVITLTCFLFAGPLSAQPDGKALFDANCKQCHTVTEQKMIGPGLQGIGQRRDMEWLIPWVKNSQAMIKAGDEYGAALAAEYNNLVMPAIALSDEEIVAIFDFVKEEEARAAAAQAAAPVAQAGEAAEEKGGPWTLLTVFLVLLVLAAILNRVKKGLENALLAKEGKKIPESLPAGKATKRWIRGNKKLIAIMVLLLFAWGSYKGWYALAAIGIHQDYAPEQPIKFSHKLHAGQDKIDCQYCHSGASKGKTAGIPSVSQCMNCHNYIQEGPVYGKEEIAKIYAALDFDPATGEYGDNPSPVQWVRVHNLPDLAYFNHAQHVNVAKIECQTCHGPVEEMDVLKQFSALTMGWCIDCHRKTEVDMAGNGYYDGFHQKLQEMHGPDAKFTVEDIGGTECIRCHY